MSEKTSPGMGITGWLECQTHDWKVVGSNPCRGGGRIFFSRVNFLCWVLFQYPFHPCVTVVAHKRSQSFCQKCRWQVTAKHPCTICLCLHEVTWCMVVWCTQNALIQQQFHVGPATSVYFQKYIYIKLVTHVESHVSAASLLKSGEQCYYIKAINNNKTPTWMASLSRWMRGTHWDFPV